MQFALGLLRVVVALLIIATALPAILAMLGFAVPILDIFNHLQLLLFFGTLIAIVFALLVRMPGAMTILAGLGFLASAWTFVPEWVSSFEPRPALPTDGRPVLKLMTHNIFGLNTDMKRMATAIFAEDPDIVALQEYFPEQTPLDALIRPRYPYAVRCEGGKRANIALYSKIPFDTEMSAGDCPRDGGQQRTAHIVASFTLADGTRFSVLTTHFDWPLPVERQQDELKIIEDVIKGISGPLIVVGDFNSTPWSYTMKGFEAATALRRETRAPLTYPMLVTVPSRISRDNLLRTIPFLPLDQVFERGIAVHELHIGAPTGSDHLPVLFRFSVSG
jgi:endonuclease/exonuclease/phosphatase (EEP) superfamily protein YafD